MTIVQINTTCGVGSTGKICIGISRMLTENGVRNHILYSCETFGDPVGIACSNRQYRKLQALKSKVLGNYGFNSRLATRKMICELEQLNPDVVHLHNIHGHDCNLELLFSYFRKKQIKLVWTFHDCWAFTGYCPHFTIARCDRWKQGCFDCPQRREFSWFLDRSFVLYEKKRRLFTGLDMTIVAPSDWLANLVRQSFLKDYSIHVIHNGIDLSVFQPTKSNFRTTYGMDQKRIILGVSFDWGEKKGLDVFAALAERLPENYQIVLVGTDEEAERQIPDGILALRRTHNQIELAEIYTAADVFINPTREESFPTVNLEALACGTPVITFRTGGSPETIDESCGVVVPYDDIDALEKEVLYVCSQRPFSTVKCTTRAQTFDREKRFKEYLKLYERIVAFGIEGN